MQLVVGVVVVIALLAFGNRFAWWQRGGMWLWWLLCALLAGGFIAMLTSGTVALLRSLAQYRQRRFLAQAQAADRVADADTEHEAQLHDKIHAAIQTLQQAPSLDQGLPLYAIPWYLLMGAGQSGKTTLLRSVAQGLAPLESPQYNSDIPTENCDWWFFNTAVILDTAGRYTCHSAGDQDSVHWYQFLQALRTVRPLQPINGLLLAVSVERLATATQDELRLDATALRKRIDEAIRELGVNFPIYLLLTRCDILEGFCEFFDHVPVGALQQVFGYACETRLPETVHPTAPTTWDVAAAFAGLVRRLEGLRLAMLNGDNVPPMPLCQKIFCFPEEFRALQHPVRNFVETLLAENPFQHRPMFRGLFLSSAQQQQAPISLLRRHLGVQQPGVPLAAGMKAYFLHDLFAVILRRDRFLVASTGRALRHRRWQQLVRVGICLGFCLLLITLLTQAFRSDRRVYATANPTACTAAWQGQSLVTRLGQAERCRQAVVSLHIQNSQRSRWRTALFNRSATLIEELRRRYVKRFAAQLLVSLDSAVDRRLTAEAGTIPLVFVLIQRIELLTQCQSWSGCPQAESPDVQPDYRLLAAVVQPEAAVAEATGMLQQTYEAYVHWASEVVPELLRQEQAGHEARLRQWFTARQLVWPQVLAWANEHYAPVTAQTYWENLAHGGARGTVQVAGGYTPPAWQQGIRPFLQRAAKAVPDMMPLLTALQDDYRAEYFTQWQRFLAAFPRSEPAWGKTPEQRRQFAAQVLTEHSPYNRIVDSVMEHLQAVLTPGVISAASATVAQQPGLSSTLSLSNLWRPLSYLKRPGGAGATAEPGQGESSRPAWVRSLQHYVESENRKMYLAGLQRLGASMASDVPLEKHLQLAQEGFLGGKPDKQSPHPVLQAWGIIEHMRQQERADSNATENVLWAVLEQPLRVGWKVVLEEAGTLLQKQWTSSVVAPLQGLPEVEQVDFLYGPQGKVQAFATQVAQAFLADNASRLGQVFGEEVPLAPAFIKTLQSDNQLRPLLERNKTLPYRVAVEATRATVLDSYTSIVEESAGFAIECAGQTWQITNRLQATSDTTTTTVPWSFGGCGDVVLTITLRCDDRCVERADAIGINVPQVASLSLRKRYPGQAGLLQFIADFQDGSQKLAGTDFTVTTTSDPAVTDATRLYRIQTITMFYRVTVPPGLSRLLAMIPHPALPQTILR